MNVAELVDLLKFYYAFNDNQSDQLFDDSRWIGVLNLAYKREWIDATQNISKKHFLEYQDITWTADSATLELPVELRNKTLFSFRDVTDSDLGVLFRPGWRDKRTLSWGTDGPSEDKTLRVFYIAAPEVLVEDGPGPALIPEDFHEILVWSAAIQLRALADDSAPGLFQGYLAEWRERLYKALSARPIADVNVINSALSESTYGSDVVFEAVSGGTVDPVAP